MAAASLFVANREDGKKDKAYRPRPLNSVTFAKDIAPITLNQCAGCHRPGGAGPFSLITFQDAAKHAEQIADVTARRFMPPWLPEPGEVEFIGARRLSAEQIGLIQQWVAEGKREGEAKDLPPVPQWSDGWELGQPDMVVTMASSYTLPSEGRDVYRNFVIPLPLQTNRFVSAIELRPGSRAVHHAFMRFDRTGQSRRLDAQDAEPGFDGMDTPSSAEGAEGYFLSWQPGKRPLRSPEGLSWPLRTGSDLVLQLHMQPTGKPELVQPSIAFFFTSEPPARIPFKFALGSYEIQIPPGVTDYRVKDTYTLPTDVDVLGLLPHAHYLGKELKAYAVLPDRSTKPLLWIKNWDFNWQGDYRFEHPVPLPKGSILTMEYSYDNSAHNVRNPNHPPKQVNYGLQTTDEMAGLMIQVLLKSRADLERTARDYQFKVAKSVISYNAFAVRQNPNNAKAHTELAKALFALGNKKDSFAHFQQAIAVNPQQADAHYHLGLMFEEQNNLAAAEKQYELALAANAELFEAHNNLGLLLMQKGRLAEAEEHFAAVIRIHPEDAIAPYNLNLVRKARGGR